MKIVNHSLVRGFIGHSRQSRSAVEIGPGMPGGQLGLFVGRAERMRSQGRRPRSDDPR